MILKMPGQSLGDRSRFSLPFYFPLSPFPPLPLPSPIPQKKRVSYLRFVLNGLPLSAFFSQGFGPPPPFFSPGGSAGVSGFLSGASASSTPSSFRAAFRFDLFSI